MAVGTEELRREVQRRDVLVGRDGDYQLLRREIVMDLADIRLPTLGLFL